MTAFQALALIIGGTASAIFLLTVLQREIRSLELVLETGLAEGVPVSVEYQRRVLWIWYLPIGMYTISLLAIGGLAMIQVGLNVADLRVRNLAYLCAAGAGMSFLMWVSGSVGGVILYTRALRQASEK
jgi:choline-glycine betaine transporter